MVQASEDEGDLAAPAGSEHEIIIELLRLVGVTDGGLGFIREVTRLLQIWTGCEAVGIRLKDGDDYPYLETRGFPEEFVEAENKLCAYDADGQMSCDSLGNPELECMCGNVLCGRFDPTKPFFSPNGSFWCNCTTDLLAATTDADRQARTRNRCNGEGYESVALIAIKTERETIGLLQLNDRRTGRFTPELISSLERLAHALAMAIDHKRAQAERERTEAWYRSIAEAYPEAICLLDGKGRITFANNSFCSALGWKFPEIEGRNYLALFPPELQEMTTGRFEDRKKGISEQYDALFHCRDGSRKWFHITGTPVLGPAGEFHGDLMVMSDITRSKEREDALRLAQYVLDKGPDAVAFIRNDGTIHYVNEAALELLGYSKQELSGMKADRIDPGFTPSIFSRLQAEKVLRYSATFYRKTGETVPVEVTACGVSFGGEYFLCAYARDISERLRAEESQRLLSLALEQSPASILITNLDGTIEYVNPRFREITGYSPEEVLGENPRIFKSGHTGADEYAALWKAITSGEQWEGEFLNKRKDGSLFWERAIISPLRNARGDISHFLAIKEDITGRKEAQKELLGYQQQLQRLASELSVAEQRERRRVASMLHDDLLQSLALSKMRLKMFSASPESEKEELLKSVDDLIEGVIQKARSLTYQLSPPILHELGLASALDWLADLVSRDFSIDCTAENDAREKPCIEEDVKSFLFVATRECVMNAIKHGSASEVRITLRSDAGSIEVGINDNGCGFSPAKAEQGGTSTGYGLFSIKERLTWMKGSLDIESRPGEGARVTLRVPASATLP